MNRPSDNETLSEAETERRFKTTLKRMLTTPHKPHSESAKPRKPGRKRKVEKIAKATAKQSSK